MKLKTYVALGTIAFTMLRRVHGIRRSVRRNAKMGLRRVQKAL